MAVDSDRAGPLAVSAAAARWSAGVIFLVFGIGKFANHASELASFRHYALPLPEVFVYAIGALEVLGGLFLVIGLLVRATALLLAGDMIGAIIVSGLGRWEIVSLTVAPTLLLAMCFLGWAGAGKWAFHSRLRTSS